MLTYAHNDDLQPLVFTMFADAVRSLRLLAGALRTASLDRLELARQAGRNFLTVTELADTLVRREGISFREAHSLVARTVESCGTNDDPASIATALLRLQPTLRLSREEIEQALDPVHFVRIRTIEGGPAPVRTAEALDRARARHRQFEEWIASQTSRIDSPAGS